MTLIVVEKNLQEKSIASFLAMNIIRASCLNAFLFLTILVRVKGRCNINPRLKWFASKRISLRDLQQLIYNGTCQLKRTDANSDKYNAISVLKFKKSTDISNRYKYFNYT